MNALSVARRAAALCAFLLLASCGGGGNGGGGGNAGPAGGAAAPLYAVGGTVSGLHGMVVLQNNGGDDVTVSANGPFAFPTSLADGAAYVVTVRTQPVGPAQTCAVANASGAVAGAAVSAVTVNCQVNLYGASASITGLSGSNLKVEFVGTDSTGLVIIDEVFVIPSSTTQLNFFRDGPSIPSGTAYQVSVRSQPTGPDETCTVAPSSGTVVSSDVNNIVVTCTPNAPSPCVTGNVYAPAPDFWSVAVLRRNGTVVTHSANVTADEVWAGDGTVHVIANPISIVAPATVTIQGCATVELAPGAGIDVLGGPPGGSTAKLIAAGDITNNLPIVFQNPDSSFAPGWGRLRGINANSLVELHYTYIYGGGNVGGSQLNAVISMNGSGTLPDPTLKVDWLYIHSYAGAGIYFSDAAFTADSDSLFVDAPDTLAAMPAMALGSIPSFIQDQASSEIKVVENANISDNLTITTTIPIHFQTAAVHVGALAPTFVPNVTLTLGPGVTLKFEGTGGIPTLVTFGGGGQAQDDNAALVVQGTNIQPVTFTSGKASPAPGDWAGLWLQTANGSHINYAIFEYAGGDAGIGPASCGAIDSNLHQHVRNTAPLIVGDGVDQQYAPPPDLVTNSTFRNNTGSYAIDSVWEAGGFGPALTATNSFDATPRACTQGKNLLVGGCIVNNIDQSGCLVP
jgi:hypothetical protein